MKQSCVVKVVGSALLIGSLGVATTMGLTGCDLSAIERFDDIRDGGLVALYGPVDDFDDESDIGLVDQLDEKEQFGNDHPVSLVYGPSPDMQSGMRLEPSFDD